jgi:lysophospholipase L1-like esterase
MLKRYILGIAITVLFSGVYVATPSTNVKGKRALFIGDSHTANHSFGWQKILSQQVGFQYGNVSISGKTTYWMLNMAVYKMNKDIDYCFIYGGANDMYSNSIKPIDAVENIRGIAKIAKHHGVKCIVLTGFDAQKCTRTGNKNYIRRYAEFQRLLLDSGVVGATVVDTRVVDRSDCGDGLCHMNQSGHRKIAEKIITDLELQKI